MHHTVLSKFYKSIAYEYNADLYEELDELNIDIINYVNDIVDNIEAENNHEN